MRLSQPGAPSDFFLGAESCILLPPTQIQKGRDQVSSLDDVPLSFAHLSTPTIVITQFPSLALSMYHYHYKQ